MKSFFQWVAKNAALSFFLGIELFCLVYGFVWALSISLEGSKKSPTREPVVLEVMIITEDSQRDFVMTEMEEFDLYQKTDYRVVSTSRENAINEFAKNENAVLILSQPLDEKEIANLKMNSSRLPLTQEIINNTAGLSDPASTFIQDNIISGEENEIVTFLKDDKAQDVVFQKYNQKSGKGAVRNS